MQTEVTTDTPVYVISKSALQSHRRAESTRQIVKNVRTTRDSLEGVLIRVAKQTQRESVW